MKVTLDLSSEIQSTSATAPSWQIIGKGASARILFLPKLRAEIADAFKIAKTAYKEASKYHKTKSNLEKLREAQKAKPSDARKTRIATMQPEVRRAKTAATQAMSAASKALRKIFGIKATFGFNASDLLDPKKFEHIAVGSKLKVKGIAKAIPLARAANQKAFDAYLGKAKSKNSTGGEIRQARASADKKKLEGGRKGLYGHLLPKGGTGTTGEPKSKTVQKNVKISKSVPESHMKAINSIAKNVTGRNSVLKASGDKIMYEAKGVKAIIQREGDEYTLTHGQKGSTKEQIRGSLTSLAKKLAKSVKLLESTKAVGGKISLGAYLKAFKNSSNYMNK